MRFLSFTILFTLAITASYSQGSLYPIRDNLNGKIGYINAQGEIVYAPNIDYGIYREYQMNLNRKEVFPYAAYLGDVGQVKFGLITAKGELLTEPKFEYVGALSEGWIRVRDKGENTYLNSRGDKVLSVGSIYSEEFHEGLAVARVDNQWGYIDKTGDIAFITSFSSIGSFSEGMATFRNGEKYGYINKNNEVIIEASYDQAFEFSDGMALVKEGVEYSFIDKNGNVLYGGFTDANSFSDGLASVKEDSKYFYINTSGERVINKEYDFAGPFIEGMAAVGTRIDNELTFGYIDQTGEYVIDPIFEFANDFKDGLALVKVESKLVNPEVGALGLFREKYIYINREGDSIYEYDVPVVARFASSGGQSVDEIVKTEVPTSVVKINTIPDGANVFFVPLDIWEDNEAEKVNIEIFEKYRSGLYTSNQFEVYNQVYMLLLTGIDKKIVKRIYDVHPYKENELEVDFSKEN